MGLIKALKGAVRSTLADQWQDYFICDSIPAGVLIVRGRKKTNSTQFESEGNMGSGDVIAKGSVIAVNEGQAMIVTDNGKIVDFTCEAGAYTFETSSAPSLFAGDLGESLVDSFHETVKRFGMGGGIGSSQRVYYINLKEIVGNKFASATPMPYDDPFYKTVLYVDYHGVYSFRISDPIYFYASVAGSVKDSYVVSQLSSQIDAEFYSAMDSAMNRLAAENVKFSQLPSKQAELSRYMSEALSEIWRGKRGIEVVSAAINKITPDEKSRARIESFDNATMLGSNAAAMQGRMADAQATVLENMGRNPQGVSGTDMMGVGIGMMGLNMLNSNMAGQMQAFAGFNPAANNAAAPANPSAAEHSWRCECGNINATPFCGICGKKSTEV
jgi:membrane protease subunit (stomatin/prohibitin family)